MNIACFTSIPSEDGEKRLVMDFGDAETRQEEGRYEMGAGDAVAATIALFNIVAPTLFIKRFCVGQEQTHARLMELASTIFVGIIGRVAGVFLLRTPATSWLNIREDAFRPLLEAVAEESLKIAREIVYKYQQPVMRRIERWGMSVVVWQPGSVDVVDVSEFL